MRNECCANQPPVKPPTDKRDRFYYLSKESLSECNGNSKECKPRLKQFSGRFEDFNNRVVKPSTISKGSYLLSINSTTFLKYFCIDCFKTISMT